MLKESPYLQSLGIKLDEIREGYAKVSITVTKESLAFQGEDENL